MDTKLKSKVKIITYGFVILLLFSYGFNTTFESIDDGSYRLKGSYFNTNEFANEIDEFLNLFAKTQLDIKDSTKESSLQVPGKSSTNSTSNAPEDIEITYVPSDATKNVTIKQTLKTNNNNELKEQEELKKDLSRFQYKQNYIKYHIQDIAGNTYTNLKENEDYNSVKDSSYFVRNFPYHTKNNDVLTSANRFFITRELTGFIAIPKDNKTHSLIVENMYDYQDSMVNYLIILAAGIIVFILSIFLGFDFRRKYKEEFLQIINPFKRFYINIPIDIRAIILFLNILFIHGWSQGITYTINYGSIYRIFQLGNMISIIIYIGALYALIIQIVFLFPTFKSMQHIRTEWSKSFIIKQKHILSNSFLFTSPVIKIVFIIGIIFGLGAIAGIGLVELHFEEILFLFPFGFIPGVVILIYVFSKLSYFNTILKYSDDVLAGKTVNEIGVKKRGLLAKLANNLNHMKTGIDQSQKEQLKGERLKTELISNVSHDLRTPLTSIMNYTELLKTKDLNEEQKNKYIEILEQKSKRLKVLIDDLFEVSKMASGNIELSIEKVDVVQLMNQALGEYDEKIKESKLDFKVTSSNPHIHVWVDGRKMWRVFDNIINNILKYSLEKTRVYITTVETDTNVIITFKNISNYELEDNIEELLERFKRGDSSRHTEGSGLGLAIAKSIVDHHGGSLDIELDGDLFKTVVKINK